MLDLIPAIFSVLGIGATTVGSGVLTVIGAIKIYRFVAQFLASSSPSPAALPFPVRGFDLDFDDDFESYAASHKVPGRVRDARFESMPDFR